MMIDNAMAPPELPVPTVASNASACDINIPPSYSQCGRMLLQTKRPREPLQPIGEIPRRVAREIVGTSKIGAKVVRHGRCIGRRSRG